MNDRKSLISVVVPLFNEEKNIEALMQRFQAVFEKQKAFDFEVIMVDDGSRDRTWERIARLSCEDPSVKGLRFSRNFGQQAALSAGIEHAQGAAVIMMDGDLQHPPEVIPELLKKWQEGFDVVHTIRKRTESIGFMKKWGSRVYSRIYNLCAPFNVPEGAVDFRLLSRKVVDQLNHCKETNRYLRGLVGWVGFESASVAYEAPARFSGRPQYSLAKSIRLACIGLTSFSALPLYLSGIIGFFVAFLSGVYIVYTVYIKFFTAGAVSGWASLLVSVLFLGGVQLIAIGILGGYLAKVYEEVKRRPLYILDDSTNMH